MKSLLKRTNRQHHPRIGNINDSGLAFSQAATNATDEK